ncbi:hypothetical protein [Listeria seeligeri]|uniref:hypothetical protein n=1 Tax=Listeria seeligeri TaxID=1640 RepID=UPI0016255EF4|nr:hypothetical protein [Listeria seeligeri]MBC1722264.1 hypothetical protein [Listeria seeligeri]MBF2435791.1 hypothetical protein [Listeria seeligeri]
MNKTELVFNIIQLFVTILAMLGIGLVPKFFYDKKMNDLNRNITRELEQIRISQENVHPEKIKLFNDVIDMFKQTLASSKMPKITEKDKDRYNEKLAVLGERYNTIMYSLMLFANDDTIDMYKNYKRFVQEYSVTFFLEKGLSEKAYSSKLMFLMCDLIITLRRDVGFPETNVKQDSLLYGILNDWGEVKKIHYDELPLIDQELKKAGFFD